MSTVNPTQSRGSRFPRLASPVKLKPSSTDGLWHRFIEAWVFHRWQSFKNSPRGNTLIVRAFLTVSSVGLFLLGVGAILCLMLCDWHKVVGEFHQATFLLHACGVFVAALATMYWQMSRLHNRHWQHCNNVYTEFLTNSKTAVVRARLANALAQDLLVCDMWALRSFGKHFRDELEKAVAHTFEKEPGSLDKTIHEINAGNLTESWADYYLSRYEDFLLSSESSEAEHDEQAAEQAVAADNPAAGTSA